MNKHELKKLFESLDDELATEFTDRYVKIRCPYPDHNDNSPSCYIRLTEPNQGSHRCYGCGMRGSWAETCRLLGINGSQRFGISDTTYDLLSDQDETKLFAGASIERKPQVRKWKQEWRGISSTILKQIGAEFLLGAKDYPLILPVSIYGRRVGSIECRIKKSSDPNDLSYVNSSGAWAESALFPYDWVRERTEDYVTLVEGPRDALNLCQLGYPALGTLGAYSWNDKCIRLVKDLGVRRAIVMADPDPAGDKLAERIYSTLKPHLPCIVVKLKRLENGRKAEDPADFDAKRAAFVYSKIGIQNGSRSTN